VGDEEAVREFPFSIYSQPRARQRPEYRRTSRLDIVRSQRRVREAEKELARRVELSGIAKTNPVLYRLLRRDRD
jgi:hypothetical protein